MIHATRAQITPWYSAEGRNWGHVWSCNR